jgi:hypothetical protein
VGHALHNDLTALLLSHPAARIRDTQLYAGRKPIPGKGKGKAKEAEGEKTLWEKYRSPRIGLKRLVKEELGIDIQAGEHSSVRDFLSSVSSVSLPGRLEGSLGVSFLGYWSQDMAAGTGMTVLGCLDPGPSMQPYLDCYLHDLHQGMTHTPIMFPVG